MGMMSEADELAMIDRFIHDDPAASLAPVASAQDVLRIQQACRDVYVHQDLKKYIAALVRETRSSNAEGGFESGVSPRGTLSLLRASQGMAMTAGRDYVVPEDIKEVAVPVLAHRLISEDPGYAEKTAVIRGLLNKVPVPTEDWSRR